MAKKSEVGENTPEYCPMPKCTRTPTYCKRECPITRRNKVQRAAEIGAREDE